MLYSRDIVVKLTAISKDLARTRRRTGAKFGKVTSRKLGAPVKQA